MAKYVYPAIFTSEENGKFSIRFPDIDGCYTCGDNLSDGMEMAQDALALMLTYLEDEKRDIPDARVCQVKCVSFFDFLSAVAFDR